MDLRVNNIFFVSKFLCFRVVFVKTICHFVLCLLILLITYNL